MDKGKLKIFFGYSAGVGKTYAMLRAARTLKKQGVDVVIGYLEPHNRPDTMKMAEGFETLPVKNIEYKGITLKEFDVDAAIARRPQLILVDELAHTNAAGSKNAKRYLDVEELLNNGISVYTTVNVQHLEGLHDLVDSATSVDVNERIPDEVFDKADEVQLVDIEPAALIERMREGKIYSKQRAETALENFFKEENLSGLRELCMRRSADRIEKQTYYGHMRNKILVLISPSPSSQKNIRVAARMAEAYHCKYSAMYVETDGVLNNRSAENLKAHMQLVKDTGGELVVKYGEDVVETVVDYVKLAGITNLIVGKTWQSVGKKVGLEDKFIAELHDIEVLIVPDNQRYLVKTNPFKTVFSKVFRFGKLMNKYKLANRTLDVIRLLAQAASTPLNVNSIANRVSRILARAFERSCEVITDQEIAVTAWNSEDVGFFDSAHEMAVAAWCKKNGKAAGKGTDTLRSAEAIYFCVNSEEQEGVNCVVALSCRENKLALAERLMFFELLDVLRLCFYKKTEPPVPAADSEDGEEISSESGYPVHAAEAPQTEIRTRASEKRN